MNAWQQEIVRKTIHVGFAVLILITFWAFHLRGWDTLYKGILVFFLLLFLFADYLRIKKRKFIPVFGHFERGYEKKIFHANTTTCFGLLLLIHFTPFFLAWTIIAMYYFADLAAAFIGTKYGMHRFKNGKSWEGTIACFLVAAAIGIALLPLSTALAIAAGMAAVEAVISGYDDNLPMLLTAGFLGTIFETLL